MPRSLKLSPDYLTARNSCDEKNREGRRDCNSCGSSQHNDLAPTASSRCRWPPKTCDIVVVWPQMATKPCAAPHSGFCTSERGEGITRVEMRNLCWGDTDSLTGEVKAHTSKAKVGIHPPVPMGRQMFSHPQESRAPSQVVVTWEDKCHDSQYPHFLPSSPSSICWACHVMAWNVL